MGRLRSETRAQGSIGLARFFLALGVGAIMLWMINMVADELLPGAKRATSTEARTQGTEWLMQTPELIAAFILLIALFGTIVSAIYHREVVQ